MNLLCVQPCCTLKLILSFMTACLRHYLYNICKVTDMCEELLFCCSSVKQLGIFRYKVCDSRAAATYRQSSYFVVRKFFYNWMFTYTSCL